MRWAPVDKGRAEGVLPTYLPSTLISAPEGCELKLRRAVAADGSGTAAGELPSGCLHLLQRKRWRGSERRRPLRPGTTTPAAGAAASTTPIHSVRLRLPPGRGLLSIGKRRASRTNIATERR